MELEADEEGIVAIYKLMKTKWNLLLLKIKSDLSGKNGIKP
jgi:hypothetical protein